MLSGGGGGGVVTDQPHGRLRSVIHFTVIMGNNGKIKTAKILSEKTRQFIFSLNG
jgi:hypothetical protein